MRPYDALARVILCKPVGADLAFALARMRGQRPRWVLPYEQRKLGSAQRLFLQAEQELARRLQIDPIELEGQRVLVLRHPRGVGASAIGLPDLHARLAPHLGADELLVGLFEPSALLVTAARSTRAATRLQELVARAPCAAGLIPACYLLSASETVRSTRFC
jgi:hypothetical protein